MKRSFLTGVGSLTLPVFKDFNGNREIQGDVFNGKLDENNSQNRAFGGVDFLIICYLPITASVRRRLAASLFLWRVPRSFH